MYNNSDMKPKYNRVIIKISGESLADRADSTILDNVQLTNVAKAIKNVKDLGVEIGVVVGAGNIWRGRLAEKIGIEPSVADYMGMLGTIMNALALQSAFEKNGMECRVMSSIDVPQVCEPYLRRKAIHHLEEGRIVIFAGGTGNPFFTTDSAAALRAKEVGAKAILMGKNGVEGVLDDDPRVNPNAKLIKKITFREVVERKLGVMDLTAVAMLEDSDIEIRVFNMASPEVLKDVICGADFGTVVRKE